MIKPNYNNSSGNYNNKKKQYNNNNNNNFQNRNKRTTNSTFNYHPNSNQPTNNHQQNNYTTKIQHPSISKLSDYTQSVTYGSFDYTLPGALPESLTASSSSTPFAPSQPAINSLPKFANRPTALLVGTKLYSTYLESLNNCKNPQRSSTDLNDPAVQIVMSNKSKSKTFRLGDIEIDIYNFSSKSKPKKLINKILTKESLVSTPLKRNRDELVEVSSSVKKNKRTLELQQQETSMVDTTMELSFEGKAMDKSDLVKLVDSSVIVPDESQLDFNDQQTMNFNGFYDTQNLLQSTEFNFEFR